MDMKFNLSFSSLNTYLTSPLTFYLQYIKKIQPKDETIQCYGVAGNVVHSYLENRLYNKEPDFNEEWKAKDLDNQYGFNQKPLSLSVYKRAADEGKHIIKNYRHLGYELSPEELFEIPYKDTNILIKGFVDVIAKKGNKVLLLDWKTNSSKKKDEYKKQMLMYGWLYWKKHNIIPNKAIWYYLKINKEESFVFTEKKLLEFENYIYGIIEEINKKGYDASKYPIGDVSSPFNGYKTKIKEMKDVQISSSSEKLLIIIKNSKIYFSNVKKEIVHLLNFEFRYELKQSYFIKKALIQKGIQVDGYKNFYNHIENTLPIGFLPRLKMFLENNLINYCIKDERIPLKNYSMPNELQGKSLRGYQQKAVDFALKEKITTLEMVTASGKTLIAAEIIRKNQGLTLFVVDRDILVKQTVKEYKELLNQEIGVISEGTINLKVINVATIQTLNSLLKKGDKDILKILNNIKTLIIDEAHTCASKSFTNLSKYIPNATLRIGLTGTYERPDGNEMMIESIVGRNVFKIEANELIQQEFIMEPNICFMKYKKKELYMPNNEEDLPNIVKYLNRYRYYLTNNEIRNKLIALISKRYQTKNIIIIVSEIEHGKILKTLIEEFYKDVVIIDGDVDSDIREEWLNKMRKNELNIIIGTASIVQKGLDITNLGCMINATGNDGSITSLQSLGRILRINSEKQECYYFDFYDDCEIFLEHTLNRIQHFKKKEYKVKIMKGSD